MDADFAGIIRDIIADPTNPNNYLKGFSAASRISPDWLPLIYLNIAMSFSEKWILPIYEKYPDSIDHYDCGNCGNHGRSKHPPNKCKRCSSSEWLEVVLDVVVGPFNALNTTYPHNPESSINGLYQGKWLENMIVMRDDWPVITGTSEEFNKMTIYSRASGELIEGLPKSIHSVILQIGIGPEFKRSERWGE